MPTYNVMVPGDECHFSYGVKKNRHGETVDGKYLLLGLSECPRLLCTAEGQMYHEFYLDLRFSAFDGTAQYVDHEVFIDLAFMAIEDWAKSAKGFSTFYDLVAPSLTMTFTRGEVLFILRDTDGKVKWDKVYKVDANGLPVVNTMTGGDVNLGG